MQVPRCQPIRSLRQLLRWHPSQDQRLPFCKTFNALLQPSPTAVVGTAEASRPRLIICHDMANGYHDDSFPQGTTDPGFYSITSWASVDVFIYFSHERVAIPTPGWIAAAHRNGVQVN
jgi:mannosyl-glycoprotein endo-beta-N-acetylglucosaminidase